MNQHMKAVFASLLAAIVINLGGVILFFEPIAKADVAAGPLVPKAVGFFIYVILTVILFDWTARLLNNAYKAAFVIAAAQFILVNVDYVLAGKRGLMTAGASTVLMVVTWTGIAYAYSYFYKFKSDIHKDNAK
jgi:hypothetical protein